jgi:hypothetical protein
LTSISRAKKNLCGGGKTAMDPAPVSRIARRLRACKATGWLLAAPPNA